MIIEIDGGHHNSPEIKKYDEERNLYLQNNGYKVLRFWNNDVKNNIDGICEVIKRELDK